LRGKCDMGIHLKATFFVFITELILTSAGFGATWVDIIAPSKGDGSVGSPYNSIRAALITRADKTGDTVYVKKGVYYNTSHVVLPSGESASKPFVLKSVDGALETVIDFAKSVKQVRMGDFCEIDGFEIRNNQDANSLLNAYTASGRHDVIVRNCYLHNAGTKNGDCIKMSSVYNVLIENNEMAYPGGGWDPPGDTLADGHQQELLDFMDHSHDIVVRNNYFHLSGHSGKPDAGCVYAKGGSYNVVYENNVFAYNYLTHKTNLPALQLGGTMGQNYGGRRGPDMDRIGDSSYDTCRNHIARNNIFFHCESGALGGGGITGAYFYNNLIYNSGYQAGYIFDLRVR